jgi:hypothetical protein
LGVGASLCKKTYCCEIQRSENRIVCFTEETNLTESSKKGGGSKRGCFADDDDDDDKQ